MNFDWSPDSRSIAFEHWPGPLADNWTKSALAEVTIESGNVRELVSKGAPSLPKYSPNGRYIAFEQSAEPVRWPSQVRITLLSRNDGSVRALTATPDESPLLIGWSGDSSRLYFNEANHTHSFVYSIPVDGPPMPFYAPDRGLVGHGSLNRTGNRLGFAYETPTDAPEAFVSSLESLRDSGRPMQVSRANADLAKLPLGETKLIHWKAKDGLDIEGLLTYPVGYKEGTKVPLILNIHGGPAGGFSESFIGRLAVYPIATFAARGYAVLLPNPRGSTGYGRISGSRTSAIGAAKITKMTWPAWIR